MHTGKGKQRDLCGGWISQELVALFGFRGIHNGQTKKMYLFCVKETGEQELQHRKVRGEEGLFISQTVLNAQMMSAVVAKNLEDLHGSEDLVVVGKFVGLVCFPPLHANGAPCFCKRSAKESAGRNITRIVAGDIFCQRIGKRFPFPPVGHMHSGEIPAQRRTALTRFEIVGEQ